MSYRLAQPIRELVPILESWIQYLQARTIWSAHPRAPWRWRRFRSRCRSPRGDSIGGLASVFAGLYHLTASQTALLVAVPVLLGSLARLPMGMLTDRFGGRLVFTALLAFSSLAAFVVPLTTQLRLAARRRRSSSAWPGRRSRSARPSCRAGRPPARQGTALGVYGLGHDGAVAGRVRRAGRRGARSAGKRCFAAPASLLLAWAVVYVAAGAQPAAAPAHRPAFGAMVAVLRRAPTAWLLGAFYFLTFGGFVAFSIYLPTLLRAQFGLRARRRRASAPPASWCSPR